MLPFALSPGGLPSSLQDQVQTLLGLSIIVCLELSEFWTASSALQAPALGEIGNRGPSRGRHRLKKWHEIIRHTGLGVVCWKASVHPSDAVSLGGTFALPAQARRWLSELEVCTDETVATSLHEPAALLTIDLSLVFQMLENFKIETKRGLEIGTKFDLILIPDKPIYLTLRPLSAHP